MALLLRVYARSIQEECKGGRKALFLGWQSRVSCTGQSALTVFLGCKECTSSWSHSWGCCLLFHPFFLASCETLSVTCSFHPCSWKIIETTRGGRRRNQTALLMTTALLQLLLYRAPFAALPVSAFFACCSSFFSSFPSHRLCRCLCLRFLYWWRLTIQRKTIQRRTSRQFHDMECQEQEDKSRDSQGDSSSEPQSTSEVTNSSDNSSETNSSQPVNITNNITNNSTNPSSSSQGTNNSDTSSSSNVTTITTSTSTSSNATTTTTSSSTSNAVDELETVERLEKYSCSEIVFHR